MNIIVKLNSNLSLIAFKTRIILEWLSVYYNSEMTDCFACRRNNGFAFHSVGRLLNVKHTHTNLPKVCG